MKFLNRNEEKERINNALKAPGACFMVIWGRRRVGKTRLLIESVKDFQGIYWVATQTDSIIQRKQFAEVVSQKIPNFADAEYTSWEQLFKRLAQDSSQFNWTGPIVFDEFPYAAESSKELVSTLQKYIDHDFKNNGIKIVIAGSSQRMMQNLALNSDAPLYGRASEIIKLEPIQAGYIKEALKLKDAVEAIEAYSIWGGIPRYWELAEPFKGDLTNAATSLILDPLGPLHNEPDRLLIEDGSSIPALKPILDIIGTGVHRVSEIAARLNTPASKLTYSLTRLQEMDIIKREVPYGENEKNSKRSLYKISDPFLHFWFSCVGNRISILTQGDNSLRKNILNTYLPQITSQTWEDLCRRSIFKLSRKIDLPTKFLMLPGGRYWSKNENEWDVVSQSEDKSILLVGEAKWSKSFAQSSVITKLYNDLTRRSLPKLKGPSPERHHYVIFIPKKPKNSLKHIPNLSVFDAKDVLSALS